MRLIVTGSTGFIGKHVVPVLLKHKHTPVFLAGDIYNDFNPSMIAKDVFDMPHTMIHLAWSGLPNYQELYHFEKNMMDDYRFIKKMVLAGVDHVVVVGTCAEYGMCSGEMFEDDDTNPVTPYGLAKDTLRKMLVLLQMEHPFVLTWVRLFYVYGEGQNPSSLLCQLDKAIDNKEPVFNMSGGEQLRDYLSVEKVAGYIVKLAEHPSCCGVINCCSGKPVSVLDMVKKHIVERGSDIKMNLGFYPYLEYEPMSFWGNADKIRSLNE